MKALLTVPNWRVGQLKKKKKWLRGAMIHEKHFFVQELFLKTQPV